MFHENDFQIDEHFNICGMSAIVTVRCWILNLTRCTRVWFAHTHTASSDFTMLLNAINSCAISPQVRNWWQNQPQSEKTSFHSPHCHLPLSPSSTSIHIQQIQASGMRSGGGGLGAEGGDGKEGGFVWVILNSVPALLVAREWPIISHWAKWHEFININNSSKFIFSGCFTEAQAGPH